MAEINVCNLTKDYDKGKGIFDINLEIEKGEIFGYVGTNGSGKTTTIRHIMGFLKPYKGNTSVQGKDSWKDASAIKKLVGYVPGEIAFPDIGTGSEFLKIQAEFLGVKNMGYANELIKKLQLDTSANLKRMSKGMKQKTAIVAAFMSDPEILILDEPTTGLDPLMRAEFVDIILDAKKKGRTIFMSSHVFEEMEDTCDRVALLKNGRIVSVTKMKDIQHHNIKTYKIEFNVKEEYSLFLQKSFNFIETKGQYNQVTIDIDDKDINLLLEALKQSDIKFLSEKKYTLEQYFNNIYKKELV